jgi:hypothetical protein
MGRGGLEQPASDLPAHERACRTAERPVLRCAAERTEVRPLDQSEPAGGVVADGLDLDDRALGGRQ